jgi:diadenosine tetraphosphate (Ap4A) HIT family hydrolase
VHWHLIPRRPSDPDPGATVWVRPSEETDCGCTVEQRKRLVTALRAAGLGVEAGRG